MKRFQIIITMVLCLCINFHASAQNNTEKLNDTGRIALNPYVPEQSEEIPVSSLSNIENVLTRIATRYGMGGSNIMPRFIISARVLVLTKDITPTAPPMHALTLEVTLYIGDGIEGKSFASTVVSLKGAGENETKAFNSALRNFDPSNKNIEKFVEEGKTKIIAYYNSQCDIIIREAKMLESQHRFDEAIYKLMCVPDVCLDCYNKAMDAVAPVFQSKINWECRAKLSEARNIWSSGQDFTAAGYAADILSTIDPESACFNDALVLTKEIAKRIKEIDGREWDFMLKKEIDLERDRIKAYRDIGVAWGTHQPQNVVYKSLW